MSAAGEKSRPTTSAPNRAQRVVPVEESGNVVEVARGMNRRHFVPPAAVGGVMPVHDQNLQAMAMIARIGEIEFARLTVGRTRLKIAVVDPNRGQHLVVVTRGEHLVGSGHLVIGD